MKDPQKEELIDDLCKFSQMTRDEAELYLQNWVDIVKNRPNKVTDYVTYEEWKKQNTILKKPDIPK